MHLPTAPVHMTVMIQVSYVKTLLPAIAAILLSGAAAEAASFCNCCGSATETGCDTACADTPGAVDECVPTVDFAAKAEITRDVNPLYNLSLRNLTLRNPDERRAELLRRLLEAGRRGAERDRDRTLRGLTRDAIDSDAVAKASARYDAAMVNYYLGMQVYQAARKGLHPSR